jgi:dihydropteroate synthase
MGILNTTPDSFSDGGHYSAPEAALLHALEMVDAGADIIDVGGESTRPPGRDYGAGAQPVAAEEEMRRTVPVIEQLHRARPDIMISIDTMKADVARAALAAGATMVNDVSAGRFDPAMLHAVAEHGAAYVVMHGHNPASPGTEPGTAHGDIVAEVFAFLRERIAAAHQAGIQHVFADVGIGFAKQPAESEQLIRELERFADLGVPLVIGASRKAFIGHALGGLAPAERLYGTLAAHAIAVINGASVVRVHDVRPAREFFTMLARLRFPGLPGIAG